MPTQDAGLGSMGSSYAKISVAAFAWMIVPLAAIHRSEAPVLLGRYSVMYACLLGALIASACALTFAKPSSLSKVWEARKEILLSAGSLFVAILLAEFAIRAVDPYGISYYEYVSDYMRSMRSDASLVYRHPPLEEKRYGDVLVRYNEKGLRDRPILSKAPGEFRILALGDSITFGWGVPEDQIFANRLEELLQNLLRTKVRVINSGVGGYNTVQEVTYFKKEGMALQPDLVILIYVENDIENARAQPKAGLEVRRPLAELVLAPLEKLWLSRFVYHAYNYGPRPRPETAVLSAQEPGWAASMSGIDDLVSTCKEHNILLEIFYYRLKPEPQSALFQDVVRHAREVPVKDIGQWLDGHDASSLVISKVDSHPNAEAHALIAENMAAEIVNRLASRK